MWPEPIAVVGIGCRFPKAPGIEQLWKLLMDGVDAAGVRPRAEWLLPSYVDETHEHIRWILDCPGGFIDRNELPANLIPDTLPDGGSVLDPQQAVFVQCATEALADAGLADLPVRDGAVVGVWCGATNIDYHRWLYSRASNICIAGYVGSAIAAISNRVSNQLNLRGPSLTIDSACTSGLAAVHLACQSLLLGESDFCLAGGINIIINPDSSLTFVASGMLSKSGRCRVFSADADGYIRAEGCAVLMLERLSQARAAGRRVHGLILGSALNHTGESAGISMPRASAQVDLIRRAHAAAGVTAAQVQYVEAHAVGTPLGDMTELASLEQVFAERAGGGGGKVTVGSLKTNFGHCEAASGLAGLLKGLCIARHRKIPPNLHFNDINPRSRKSGRVLHIPLEAMDAGAGRVIAGVSTFGATGANGHMIVAADAS
ncbi:polyketide synthase [Ramlibacter tataouinensis]|uniref:Polyketide synthase protein-like protein n=1 Tax=Ramlibacter tataouinensis (strain ATCC BAA-407 / DSM 14655 / LMG 21543 / TTB310) TaxID=365046 RepID=F5XVI4_RAMTT|nr:polyketide synthase [Ramlibacter tataouinensis]AEG91560.1 polyketide synthase protein-like protein [Ramlibacter tataouinensis TTB310]